MHFLKVVLAGNKFDTTAIAVTMDIKGNLSGANARLKSD